MKDKNRNRSDVPTIVAISTPPGIGGVGVVRLSGPSSLSIAQTIFQTSSANLAKPSPRMEHSRLYYGVIRNPQTDETVDDGYAVFFQSPNSFTGEDIVELQLHGNPFLLSSVVELCVSQGARLAQPGEFTKRSYLNGKMDLVQAEAVAELIHSQSIVEARQSRLRLDGKLSNHIMDVREQVIDVLAEIEADVDFPDEEIDHESRKTLINQISTIQQTTAGILQTYQRNQKIHSGYRVALVGKPNVGKSSLFNAILQLDRAIVTSQAGTTRDVLSEEMIIDGYRVKFFDTAGLRSETKDFIEKEGITRSQQEIQKADLVWWIGSASEKISADEIQILQTLEKSKSWMIWNKTDLQQPDVSAEKYVDRSFLVSAKTSVGIDGLLDALKKKIQSESLSEFGGGISNDRQNELLVTALTHIQHTQQMLEQNEPPELVAVEFRQVFHAFNRLLGKEENLEAVYDRIFSKFCIGK
jgi:tRNA modification GTPase